MIHVLMHYNDFDLSTTSNHRRQNNVKTNIPLQKVYECIYFTFESVSKIEYNNNTLKFNN